MRRPLGRCASRVRPGDNDLQPLVQVKPAGHLDPHPLGVDRGELGHRDRHDRQQRHQGPPLCRWRKRGARANAIGISRGGRTTKFHALVDVLGRPLRLVLTPGNTSDVKGADLLIGETVGMKRVIAERGDDANRIRAALREQGTIPVIPGRRNRKRPTEYDQRRYKDRWQVEAIFCRLKALAALPFGSAASLLLRQARQKLPIRRRPRSSGRLLAVMGSQPPSEAHLQVWAKPHLRFYLLFGNGAPGRTRTCCLKIRSLALYPDELRARAGCVISALCRTGKSR